MAEQTTPPSHLLKPPMAEHQLRRIRDYLVSPSPLAYPTRDGLRSGAAWDLLHEAERARAMEAHLLDDRDDDMRAVADMLQASKRIGEYGLVMDEDTVAELVAWLVRAADEVRGCFASRIAELEQRNTVATNLTEGCGDA